jgi:hypothetical protein
MVMDSDEKIQAHVVSIWRESKKFFSIGGREGMLILTNKHLMFVHKTEAKKKWWGAIRKRQTVHFLKSKDTMITHDGYYEENLKIDMENEKNVELRFDDILNISHEEKVWGSVLLIEYEKNGKLEKHQYGIAQDWVKYPAKEPTKYMRANWEPFVQYIRDRQKITR